MLANAPHISSLFDNIPTGLLKFQTSDKAATLVSYFGASLGNLIESADMSLLSFQVQMHKPFLANFTCRVPESWCHFLKQRPIGISPFHGRGTSSVVSSWTGASSPHQWNPKR
jgi:hypothetical protein